MLKAFVRGCKKAQTPEDAARLSIAAAPFSLPKEALQPFTVNDTMLMAKHPPGSGTKTVNIMETLLEENTNYEEPFPHPLVFAVESMEALTNQSVMKTLLKEHLEIEHLQLIHGPGVSIQQAYMNTTKTSALAFCLDFPILDKPPFDQPFEPQQQSRLVTCKFSKDAHIKFLRVSAYVISRKPAQGAGPELIYADRGKIIFIESPNPIEMAKLLSYHLRDHPYRAQRIRDPNWIFCDLFTIFSRTEVIKCLSVELKETYNNGLDEIELVKLQDLHSRKIRVIIDISETFHVSSVVCTDMKTLSSRVSMSYMDYGAEFRYRIAEIKSRLDHDERRLLVFRQQFQNLVDLCCNIIAIQQGDAVKRLSVLGFTFIPISFVASIFGITELHANPIYFPISAIPTLGIICLIAWLISRHRSGNIQKTQRYHSASPLGEPSSALDGSLNSTENSQLPLYHTGATRTSRFKSLFARSSTRADQPTHDQQSPPDHDPDFSAFIFDITSPENMPNSPTIDHRPKTPFDRNRHKTHQVPPKSSTYVYGTDILTSNDQPHSDRNQKSHAGRQRFLSVSGTEEGFTPRKKKHETRKQPFNRHTESTSTEDSISDDKSTTPSASSSESDARPRREPPNKARRRARNGYYEQHPAFLAPPPPQHQLRSLISPRGSPRLTSRRRQSVSWDLASTGPVSGNSDAYYPPNPKILEAHLQPTSQIQKTLEQNLNSSSQNIRIDEEDLTLRSNPPTAEETLIELLRDTLAILEDQKPKREGSSMMQGVAGGEGMGTTVGTVASGETGTSHEVSLEREEAVKVRPGMPERGEIGAGHSVGPVAPSEIEVAHPIGDEIDFEKPALAE